MTINTDLPAVKQIVRYISKSGITNPELGMFAESEVSAYISEWVAKGYKVLNVVHLDDSPDGAIGLLYLLVRSDALA